MRHWFIISLLMLVLVSCTGGESNAKGKIYRIGRDISWYPRSFVGQETAVTAFSDELCGAIARKEQAQFYLYTASWDALFSMLEQQQFDGVLGSLPLSPETRAQYDFSDPYLLIGPVLVVPFDSAVTSLNQMEGKIIGISSNSGALQIATQVPFIAIQPYSNMTVALEDLYRGKVDGVLLEDLVAQRFCRDLYANKLKVVTPPLNDEALRLFVLKGKFPELIQSFNQGLKVIQVEGEYSALEKKWGLAE